MRVIPKKSKIKNTIWKNYTILNLLIGLVVLGIAIFLLFNGKFLISIFVIIVMMILYIPTPEGLFYSFVKDNFLFLFSKKRYSNIDIDKLYEIKDI